ncbi:DUF2017 domain-containing protein [Nesterenkonia alba]|uniref:DUF2017 domain-containing protein n=1 Tax=Nesterenkonia alba TaxID=515814 RepID=UPI0003B6F40A|nr:DUF2017 domain-containing protein [Nesterenkonia alba]
MARAFRATTYGYKADLGDHERRLLTGLCADVITLLERRGQEVTAGGGFTESTESDDAGTPAQPEDSVFAHFSAELAGLGEDTPLQPPRDKVLARLLPDAHTEPEEAGQLRRLTEASLRESKIADLRTARMLLETTPVKLTEDQAPAFGRALNDVRLTLAVRLGIETDEDADRIREVAISGHAKTTESFMAEIYTFVTWLQETLFTAMIGMLPDQPERE